MLRCNCVRSQMLFDMGANRNLAYTSFGYNSAFENFTIGISRRDYFKRIKKEIIGFLDTSLPLSSQFFTRRSVRKGFQIDLYSKDSFRIPFIFASSSIVREDHFFKFHDFTAEFSILPGYYSKKYTFALDLRYELIVYRYKKYTSNYRREIDPQAKSHWEKPFYSIAKVGVVAGMSVNNWVFYLKTGYERNPITTNHYFPGYGLLGFGYKFGTRPLK